MSLDQLYNTPTLTIESENAAVVDFTSLHVAGNGSDIQRATNLFYAVRDVIRYDPYHIDLSANGMKASTTVIDRARMVCLESDSACRLLQIDRHRRQTRVC